MEYGKFFRDCRKQSGYTQKQVADILGIYQSNVSDWENNVSRPEYENLIALSRLYRVSLYDLPGADENVF